MTEFETEYSIKLNEVLKPKDSNRYLVLDLFAGCGGLALGFEAQGFNTIGFEMVAEYCATYNLNLNGKCHELVITPAFRFPKADIIIGGPPCQPFSVIGKQNGFKDTRDGFPAFYAAVKQLDPEIFLFENVRGMFYRNRWYLDEIVKSLKSLDYLIEYRLLNAFNYGVPQKRERLILIGHRGKYDFPRSDNHPVTVSDALGDMLLSVPPESQFLTPSMDRYIAEYERKSNCITPRDLHFDQPSRTLTCRNLCGSTSDMMRVKLPDGRRRRLLLREAARLQSFPDWFKFVGNESSQFNQIGNAVPPLFAYHIAESILNYLKKDFRYSLEEIRKLNKKAVRLKQDDLPFSGSPNVKLKSPIVSKESNIMENVRFKYLLTKTEAVASNVKQMSYKTFDKKAPELRELINDTLYLLEKLGVPVMEKSPRHREMMALSFLAICNVKKKVDWSNAKCLSDNYALSTREIIAYINANFSEDVSSGSYDDIRRKHLLHPRLAGIVVPSKEDAATNDPQRKWGLNKEYSNIIKTFDQPEWEKSVEEFLKGKELLIEQLYQERQIRKIPVNLPGEVKIELEAGSHNLIQKAIIEEFLPRFGAGAEIVYVGDANNKRLYYDAEKADNLSLGKLQHEELPDVIAYSKDKNWLFLIEAVHSANPISSERIVMLKNFLKNCTADVIYVTAFKDREVMKNFIFDIAWETEVWIASDPDHMIHFDGEKFLGPFKNP